MEEELFTLPDNLFNNHPLAVSTGLGDALDGLCAALAGGEDPAPRALGANLELITRWLSAPEAAPDGGEAAAWSADILFSPGMGGSVECSRGESCSLFFSLDSSRRPYQGAWRDAAPGSPVREAEFWLEDGPAGTQLVLKGAAGTRRLDLPALSAAGAWGKENDFLQALSSSLGMLREGAARAAESVAPPADAEQEPAGPVCARCGSPLKPGKKFCGNCGAAAAEAPVAKSVTCARCGSPLKPGKKFCGNCGSPQP